MSEGRVIEAGGVRTHVHVDGDGPPLLLLHGSGPGVSAWSNWRLVFGGLAERFTVIAPDQLGFNRTAPPPDGRYGRAAWTRHAFAVLDALDVERCAIIGNSMGGAIALSMAHEQPERVERLVAMGPMGMHFPLPDGLAQAWSYTPSVENMRALLRRFAYDQSIVTDELVRTRYEASIAPGLQEAFAAMFPDPRQAGVDDLALEDDELRALALPVLAVHGRDDEIIPLATSLKLLDLLPDVRLHVFGRCGHWVMVEHPAAFERLVCDFLTDDSKVGTR